MGITGVLFIVEAIINIAGEGISDTVDCSQSIDDVEIEFWEELISVSLTAVKFTSDDEVFQILVISKHSYRVRDAISFKVLLFKCFDNDQ